MLKKLRIRLTLICVITTGVLLSVMAIVLLMASERQIDTQVSASFQGNVNTLVYKLQRSNTVDTIWLAQMEAGNDLIIHLEDNGSSLWFSGAWTPPTDRDTLIASAQERALLEYGLDPKEKPTSSIDVKELYFEITGDHNDRYLASVVAIPSSKGWMSATVLYSFTSIQNQYIMLRLTFFAAILCTLALLLLFSLWFSKRAIVPIEESNRKQVEFVAAASHELRSPLAVVHAAVSILRVTDKRQDVEKYSDVADKECMKMSRLIDDLLLLASVDAKNWSVQFKPVEMDTLLINLYEAQGPVARKKDQHLKLVLPDEALPVINGDSMRLQQALAILMDNGFSYTPNGGSITIFATVTKRYVEIQVADSGPGIPDSIKEQVFERFFRADPSRTKKEHYGLGLSIAKEIVTLHHGKISVSDADGGGAVFHIKLPIPSQQ